MEQAVRTMAARLQFAVVVKLSQERLGFTCNGTLIRRLTTVLPHHHGTVADGHRYGCGCCCRHGDDDPVRLLLVLHYFYTGFFFGLYQEDEADDTHILFFELEFLPLDSRRRPRPPPPPSGRTTVFFPCTFHDNIIITIF